MNLVNEEKFDSFFTFLSEVWVKEEDLNWAFKYTWKPKSLNPKSQPFKPKSNNVSEDMQQETTQQFQTLNPNSKPFVHRHSVSMTNISEISQEKLIQKEETQLSLNFAKVLKSSKMMGNLQAWSV